MAKLRPIWFRADTPIERSHASQIARRKTLRFDDGAAGEIDLAEDLNGPVFEPLRDEEMFRRFTVHEELHTLVWPNGADLAPEFLRAKLRFR